MLLLISPPAGPEISPMLPSVPPSTDVSVTDACLKRSAVNGKEAKKQCSLGMLQLELFYKLVFFFFAENSMSQCTTQDSNMNALSI